MTFYWIYDLPEWQLATVIVSVGVLGSILGYFATRPAVRRLLGSTGRYNDLVSWVSAGIGVFYGLALGLIAVATWQDYSEVDGLSSKEAAVIGSLYDDLDGYARPFRTGLEDQLRAYTRFIVEEDWPAHRRGRVVDRARGCSRSSKTRSWDSSRGANGRRSSTPRSSTT